MNQNRIRYMSIAMLAVILTIGALCIATSAMAEGENDMVLVLDISGSMRDSEIVSGTGVSFLDYEKELANNILDDEEFRDDYVGVVAFGGQAYMVSPLVYFGNDQTRASLKDTIRAIEPTGQLSTDLEDGLSMVEEILANSTGAKDVIILSDGQKIDYESSLAIATQMKDKSIKLHFIQVTSSPISVLTSYEKIAHAVDASFIQTTYPRLIVIENGQPEAEPMPIPRTITVGHTADADYWTIQEAVDAADTGDVIYVWNGSYSENVDVVGIAHLTLEGEGADMVTVTAADSGESVFKVRTNHVNISGFAVRGATDYYIAGIHLTGADYCNISGNDAYGNSRGIRLRQSDNNTLANNTVNSNDCGIYLYGSSNNTLASNTVNSNNDHGVYLESSSNNNTLMNNTVNSNNDYGVNLGFSSNYNTLINNTVSSSYHGIALRYSSNYNTLTNNAVSNNDYGICLQTHSCNYNTIMSNTISNNTWGIWLQSSSNYNTLTSNTISNNDRGIAISGSTGNNISYNDIIENGNYNTTSGGWEWQFYIHQYQPVEAKHNYWGAEMNNSTIDASIYDDEEGGWGEVEFYPFVERTDGGGCGGGGCYPPGWGGTPAVQIRAGDGSDLPATVLVDKIFTVLITENGSSIGAGTHVAFRIPYDTGDPVTVSTDDDGKVTYRPLITGTLGIRVLNATGGKVAGAEIEVTAGPEQLDRVVISPDSVDLPMGGTQQFYATCYATNATGGGTISNCTVTWDTSRSSTRCGIGTINSSTGLFTATGVGTATVKVIVTYEYVTRTDTAIVNVTMPPVVITDTDGDGVPDIWDADNSTPAGYWVNSDGVGRRWGDMNGDGKLTSVDALMILQAAAGAISL